MVRFGRLKNLTRDIISTHRRSPACLALHRVTSFLESAYANEGSDFDSNGERTLLENLAPFSFQRAFDAGANFGDWTEKALAVRPGCEIHAFEVVPCTFQHLSERLWPVQNNTRVILNGLGLSDQESVSRRYYDPG